MPLIQPPGQRRVDNSIHSAQVKSWVRLNLRNEDVSVVVTEASCSEDSCSPLETLIAVLSDPPVTIHIDKAMADVTAEDVQAAFP